jgi:hypothetical protein
MTPFHIGKVKGWPLFEKTGAKPTFYREVSWNGCRNHREGAKLFSGIVNWVAEQGSI